MAKQARTVLSLAFGLAVRYDALEKNPVRDTARLRMPPPEAMALTAVQVDAIRVALRGWRRGPGVLMLGTPARIGEVLAIRKGDVDVTWSPATVRISGTIVFPSGKADPSSAPPQGTQKSTRTVSVPSFTAAVLRDRLVKIASDEPEHLIFLSRNGTPLTTNNHRRRLRGVLDEAGIEGVTPHPLRRPSARSSTGRVEPTWQPNCSATPLRHHQGALHPARRGSRSDHGRDPGVIGSEADRGAGMSDDIGEPAPLPIRNAAPHP